MVVPYVENLQPPSIHIREFGCIIDLCGHTLTVEEISVLHQFKNAHLAAMFTMLKNYCSTWMSPDGTSCTDATSHNNQWVWGILILESETRFMERWDVLIARPVHSVSAGSGEDTQSLKYSNHCVPRWETWCVIAIEYGTEIDTGELLLLGTHQGIYYLFSKSLWRNCWMICRAEDY